MDSSASLSCHASGRNPKFRLRLKAKENSTMQHVLQHILIMNENLPWLQRLQGSQAEIKVGFQAMAAPTQHSIWAFTAREADAPAVSMSLSCAPGFSAIAAEMLGYCHLPLGQYCSHLSAISVQPQRRCSTANGWRQPRIASNSAKPQVEAHWL